MSRNKPFVIQLVIVGGFLIFLYIFFALAMSIYRDYNLEVNIEKFEDEINKLAELANQKPQDVLYYQSEQYKDKYAKESLNLLNPGEKLIIIPQEDKIVKSEIVRGRSKNVDVLKLPNRNQWWEYYFGRTLSISTKQQDSDITTKRIRNQEGKSIEENHNADEESLLEIEG